MLCDLILLRVSTIPRMKTWIILMGTSILVALAAPKGKWENSQVPAPPEQAPVSPAKEDQEMDIEHGDSVHNLETLKHRKRRSIDSKLSMGKAESFKETKTRGKRYVPVGGKHGSTMLRKIRVKRQAPPEYAEPDYGSDSVQENIENLSDEELAELIYLLGVVDPSETEKREADTEDYDDYEDSDYEIIPVEYLDYEPSDISWTDQPVAIPYVLPYETSGEDVPSENRLVDFLAQEALKEAETEDEEEKEPSRLVDPEQNIEKRAEPPSEEYIIPDLESDDLNYGVDSPDYMELAGVVLVPLEYPEDSSEMIPDSLDSLELSDRIAELADALNERQS